MLWLDRSRGNTLQIKGVGERLKGGRALRVQRVHAWSEHLPVDLPVYGSQPFVKCQVSRCARLLSVTLWGYPHRLLPLAVR